MAARSNWDGLGVRRGSLDSNSKQIDKKKLGVIPFKCSIHPRHITQNMENKLSSSASNSCQHSPLRTAGMLPDHYKELEHLRKENFNLKLRIYLLEKEMVAPNSNEDDPGSMKFDMELENEIRDKMLDEAVRTSKINEAKFVKAEKQIKELMSAKEKLEAQLDELRSAFYKKDMDVQELRHTVQDKDQEIQSLKENKHKMKYVIQQLVVELNKNSPDKKGDKLLKSNLGVQSPKSKLGENKTPSPSRNVEACSPIASEIVSPLQSPQKDNLQKEDTVNQMNTAVESLMKTNEKLSSELEGKTKLVKDLQESLQEMTEQLHNLKRDLCGTNANHLCSNCKHKDPSLTLNESVQTVPIDNHSISNEEEKEAVIASLQERIMELHTHIQDLNHQKSTIFKQHNVLQEHLEKLAHFMADLIDSRLSITGGDSHAASQFLSAVSKCIESTMELSHSFMQDVSSLNPCDFTELDDPSFAPGSNFIFESTRHSVFLRPSSPKDENVNEVSGKDTSEGILSNSNLSSSVTNEENKSQASRRRTFPSSRRIPAVNLQHRFSEVCGVQGSDHRDSLVTKDLSDEKNGTLTYLPTDTAHKTRTCWDLTDELPCESVNVSQHGVNMNMEPDHDAPIQIRLSSDSDIWSEPDREVSLQRVGIEMKKPVPSPQQKRSSRTRCTDDDSRNSSDTLSEGGSNNRRKRHLGHSAHDVQLKIVELQQQLSDYKRHLQFAQEKVESLLREKQFLNQQLIQSEEKNHSLKELLEKLNYEKSIYKQENLQNKADFSTVENLCNDLQSQLQLTKEKLKELYERCRQYEEEVSSLKNEKKDLVEENQSLQNIIKLQACSDSQLPANYSYVNASFEQNPAHPEELQKGDARAMLSIKQEEGNDGHSKTSLLSQQDDSSNALLQNTNDYLEQRKFSHHILEKDMVETLKTWSVLTDHSVKGTFEVEDEAAKKDSQILLLKNTISEQKQKFHKAIWKKDFMLVTKTMLNQRLTAEVEEKNEVIKTLQAEVDHKKETITTLQKQLSDLEEEKELLESEKMELFSRISTYTNETRDIQAQLLELKKQVQERELSQDETEREAEDLKHELQVKDAEINCLTNGCSELKVLKSKPERNRKMLNQTVQTEKSTDSVSADEDVARLSGEIHLLNSQLHKTKDMLHKREALCRNLHSQVQDLRHKIRDLKHSSVQHETSFQGQNDSRDSFKLKVDSSFQISEEEITPKSIPSSEQQNEVSDVCQIIVKKEEFEEKLATIIKFQKQISDLESELHCMERESRSIKEQNVNLLQQLKEQNSTIQNLSDENKVINVHLSRLKDTKALGNLSGSESGSKILQLQQDLADKELVIANLSKDRQHVYDSLLLSSNHFKQEFKRKNDLIDQLQLSLKEKSELLYQFKNTLQEKARLIDQQALELEQSLNRTSKLQAELVESSKLMEKLSSELEVKSCLIEKLNKFKEEIKNHCFHVRKKFCVLEANKEHEKSSHDEFQLIDQGEEHKSELRHINKKLKQCSDSVTSQKEISELCSSTHCDDTAAQTPLHMSSEELEAADVIEYMTIMLENKQREQALQHQVEECHKELKSFELQYRNIQDQNTSLQEKLNSNNLFAQKVVEDGKLAQTKLSEFEKQMKCMEEAEIKLKSQMSEMLDELSLKDTHITSLNQEKQNLQSLVNQYENHSKEMELHVKNATDDFTIMQNNLKEKCCLIEELNDELTAKTNIIGQLEQNDKEKSDFVSQLQSQLDDKIKCIEQQSLDLREKCGCISKLREELATLHDFINQLKSDLDSKMACVNKLNSDLDHKTEINVQLEQELKHKVDLIDKYKDNNKSKSKLIAGLKESIEARSDTVKHLEKELDHKSVTIGELKNQVNQKSLEWEDVCKKLVTSENLVAEKEKAVNVLEEKITELQSVITIKVPRNRNTAKSSCDKEVQHNHSHEEKENQLLLGTMLEKLKMSSNRKLSLQKSILQLQLKLFKNTTLPIQQHIIFVDRITTLYSNIVPVCHTSNNTNIPIKLEEQQFLQSLEADIEFLKNIRHFLKHIVLPSMKCETSVSVKSSPSPKDGGWLHEMEPWDKSDEEIASLLNVTKTVKNGLTSFDVTHTDNICKQSEDGDGTLTPVYMETSDHDSRIELEQGLTTAGYDQPAYEYLEPINSRSKYSSPDLGIESDPNQDPVVHKPVDRREFPIMNKDPLHSQLYYNQEEEAWANTSHICAVGVLKDFEFLRKEVEECMVGMKAISSRASEGLKTFGKSTSPRKMLECSTLKGVLDSCKNVEMCLHQAEKLINNFWFGPYPKHEDRAFDVVFKENQTLKQKIKDLADELKQMKSALKESEKKAEAKARSISKQLVETKRVLRKAKANFEQKLGSTGQ